MDYIWIVVAALAVAIVACRLFSRRMSPQQFMDAVQARMQSHYPHITPKSSTEFGWNLEVGGRELQVYLDNVYAVYLRRPRPFNELIDSFLARIAQADPEKDIGWDEARHRIMPLIRRERYIEAVRDLRPMGESRPMVVFDFMDDVKMTIVIDSEIFVRVVTEDDLERWQVSRDELRERAMRNLVVRTGPLWVPAADEAKKDGFFAFDTADGYDATRILLPDLPGRVSRALECEKIAVIAPVRDMLLAFAADDEGILARVQKIAQEHFSKGLYPISPGVFLFAPEEQDECGETSESDQ